MKVVFFCGGMGTRMREFSETIPKALVNVGRRPILWHLMKYYAHFGHTEFILCLGYKGEMIREYFLNYDPLLVEDCVLDRGRPKLTSSGSDVADWSISFVDTGLHRNIGERLVAVRHLVENEELFLANYSDQLCDLDLDHYLHQVRERGNIASFVSVIPGMSFHGVDVAEDGRVRQIAPWVESGVWINGGYLALQPAVFDYIRPGEELVEEPFQRLIAESQLYSYRHRGFWQAMDTYKDKVRFDGYCESNRRPWEVWADPC